MGDVRIDPIHPSDEKVEKFSETLVISNYNLKNNLDECFDALKERKISHIHFQTNRIDFLDDFPLEGVKGINLQFPVEDISPIFSFSELTHLRLPFNKTQPIDFSAFPNLISLKGCFPKRYKNLDKLKHLRYAGLAKYKKQDFGEFSSFDELRELRVFELYPESLEGLGDLAKLESVHLENCYRLESLNGIGPNNKSLRRIVISDSKRLRYGEALQLPPNLKELILAQIPQLSSLAFLESIQNIERLIIAPTHVGVRRNDYYPLIRVLKRLDQLDYLTKWDELDGYLNEEVELTEDEESIDELGLYKRLLPFRRWVSKMEYGLLMYTEENCSEAVAIIESLIDSLKEYVKMDLEDRLKLIENTVRNLNEFNGRVGDFISTSERETFCEIIDNIAEAVGIDILDYEWDIAYQWREW